MVRLWKPPPMKQGLWRLCKRAGGREPLSIPDTKDSYLAHFPSTSGSEISVIQNTWLYSMSPTGSEQSGGVGSATPGSPGPILCPISGPSWALRVGRELQMAERPLSEEGCQPRPRGFESPQAPLLEPPEEEYNDIWGGVFSPQLD